MELVCVCDVVDVVVCSLNATMTVMCRLCM
jgi:hypothetical protein